VGGAQERAANAASPVGGVDEEQEHLAGFGVRGV
jgi:hypothetical protein